MPRLLTRHEEVAIPVHLISDRTGEKLESDNVATETLTFIPYVHHKVHESVTFQSSYKTPEGSDVADDASQDWLIQVRADRVPHLVYEVACGGDAEVSLYEAPTVSSNGTALARVNMDRNSQGGSDVLTFRDPTVTVVGNLIQNTLIPGGTQPRTGGGVGRQNTEWLLRLNTLYLLRVTNRSGGAQPVSVLIQWYEKEP